MCPALDLTFYTLFPKLFLQVSSLLTVLYLESKWLLSEHFNLNKLNNVFYIDSEFEDHFLLLHLLGI